MTLDQILDEVEMLPNDDLLMFNDIVSNRIKETQRNELISNVLSSREEFKNGNTNVSTVEDIMNEIMS